jgi:lipopolysaccharide/colanic/teichoic acid biosynthesis glycosyltransferase
MANKPNDLERLTLASLGLSSAEEIQQFQEDLCDPAVLAARRDANVRDRDREIRQLAAYPRRKREIDVMVSLLLLTLFLPLIAFFSIVIRLTDWGPAIITVPAMGRGGRYFSLYRLRCLYLKYQKVRDAEGPAPQEAPKYDDPRFTPIGRFLNRFRIGRLPSIWNVLRGDMSLVGPRPQFHVLADRIMQDHPEHVDRTQALPGIIGLWHVLLKKPITTDRFPELLSVDLYYTSHATLSLDMRILLAAGLLLCRLPRGFVIRFSGLPALAAILRVERVEEPAVLEAYSPFLDLYRIAGPALA